MYLFKAVIVATLAQIKSPVWAYSMQGGGAIAEGLSAIRQAIDIIIRTTKGTDPLRPTFGSDVYLYQDYPANVAIPNIKLAILTAIATWEKRVVVTKIGHSINGSQLLFDINYRLVDESMSDMLTLSVGNGGVNTGSGNLRLILQGYFPPNPSGYQYQVQCVLNGVSILPAPPANGFADIAELYAWVQDNWLNYGNWYTNAESLVGYMNPNYRTGQLSISVLSQNRFQGGIPPLPVAYKYHVPIDVDGQLYENDVDLFTPDQVKQWAELNLGFLGNWAILTRSGSFNDDFTDDFEKYSQVLVLFTNKAGRVIIDINTIPQNG